MMTSFPCLGHTRQINWRIFAILVLLSFPIIEGSAQSAISILQNGNRTTADVKKRVLGELMDSLQTALNLTPLEVAPVVQNGTRSIQRFDQAAFLASFAEMRDELGLDFDMPTRINANSIGNLLTMVLEAAKEQPPSVQTSIVTQVAQLVATLNGSVTKDGRKPLMSWGFKMGLDSSLADSILVPFGDYQGFLDTSIADTGVFHLDQTGLTRYTQYYYSAWGKNEKGMGFGDTLSFRTLPDLASGLALDTAEVLKNSAVFKLSISDAGGQGPDSVGFFYDTLDFSSTQTVLDSLPSDSLSGTSHTVSVTGLSRYTQYYFNAYADNLAGRSMASANMTFTTLPDLPTLGAFYYDSANDSLIVVITDDGGQSPTSLSFAVDTVSTLDNSQSIAGVSLADSSKGHFANAGGQTYHGVAIVTNNAGSSRSDTISWQTQVGVITSDKVEDKTDSTGTIKAQFTFGDLAPTATGFKWGLSPTLAGASDSVITIGADSTITLPLVSLQKDSVYYYVGFATNDAGTAYGDTLSFAAKSFSCEPPTFDNYTYDVVVIGEQCWFAENLRTAVYTSGDSIQISGHLISWPHNWDELPLIFYPNDDETALDHGPYYNLATANLPSSGQVCPLGWHVPSRNEFETLARFVSTSESSPYTGIEGLIQSSGANWIGSNATGFSALPAGSFNVGQGGVYALDYQAIFVLKDHWWASISGGGYGLNIYASQTDHAMSIRCIQDSIQAPVVQTALPYGPHDNSTVTLSGRVEQDFINPVSEVHFEWSYAEDLSNATTVAIDTTAGPIEYELTGLSTGERVYYRIVATNEIGTTEGEIMSLVPSDEWCQPVSYQGHTYDVVNIDGQCWFAENLRNTHYANGDEIYTSMDLWELYVNRTGAYTAIYDESGDSIPVVAEHGLLYDLNAANNPKGLCPVGWHIPTSHAYEDLFEFAGGPEVAAGKLKASPSDSPSWDGTNDFGFNAIGSSYLKPYWNSDDDYRYSTGNQRWENIALGDRVSYLTSNYVGGYGGVGGFTFVSDDNGTVHFLPEQTDKLAARCRRDSIQLPISITRLPRNVNPTSFKMAGEVKSNYEAITEKGFRWGHSRDLSDAVTVPMVSTDYTMESEVSGLGIGDTIYYTTYGVNQLGTQTGDTMEVILRLPCVSPTMDNYTYEVVEVGSQCWFKENLRTSVYANGESILTTTSTGNETKEWRYNIFLNDYDPHYGWTMNDMIDFYGWNYSVAAAIDSRNICPSGWHVPTVNDFETLVQSLGENPGMKLKSTYSEGWTTNRSTYIWGISYSSLKSSGNNQSGFSGLPGDIGGSYGSPEYEAQWLSQSPNEVQNITGAIDYYGLTLRPGNDDVYWDHVWDISNDHGKVRCIMD